MSPQKASTSPSQREDPFRTAVKDRKDYPFCADRSRQASKRWSSSGVYEVSPSRNAHAHTPGPEVGLYTTHNGFKLLNS